MKRTPLIAATLAAVYFLLAFNAYACFVPLYGDVQAAKQRDCAMPKEPPIRDACDAFKAIGVQTLSSAHPLLDCHFQCVVSAPALISSAIATLSSRHDFSGTPPFLDRDPLSLTSILRI